MLKFPCSVEDSDEVDSVHVCQMKMVLVLHHHWSSLVVCYQMTVLIQMHQQKEQATKNTENMSEKENIYIKT